MDDVVVVVRVVLAVVFIVAAAAKWSDRPGTAAAARALGLPPVVAQVVPIALPCVEVVVAAGLFPVSTAPWAAAALAALIAGFTVLVAANLWKGRRPVCHCFGAMDTEPIGGRTLVRNVVLLAASVFVAGAGTRPDAHVSAAGPAVDAALFAGFVVLGLLVARRDPERTPRPTPSTRRARDLPPAPTIGDPAPTLAVTNLDGTTVDVVALARNDAPVLLVLGDLGCGSCKALLPQIERWQTEYADAFIPAYVVSASADAARGVASQYSVDHFLVYHDGRVTDRFGGVSTPTAVVIAADGTIAHAPVSGRDAIRTLVGDLAGWRAEPYEPPVETRDALEGTATAEIGSALPRFRLPAAGGTVVSDDDLPRTPLAFVFVQPDSSYSAELLDELARHQDLARRAVLVATAATAPDARLHQPVLVDSLGLLAAAFGVRMVPTAIAAADGVITSAPVTGVEPVLDLLRSTPAEPITPAEVTPSFVPRPSPSVVTVAVNGTTVVADPRSRAYHSLHATAGIVWPCFDGTASVADVASTLSEEFGVPVEVVEADVLAFARQLASAGVLDGVERSASVASSGTQDGDAPASTS